MRVMRAFVGWRSWAAITCALSFQVSACGSSRSGSPSAQSGSAGQGAAGESDGNGGSAQAGRAGAGGSGGSGAQAGGTGEAGAGGVEPEPGELTALPGELRRLTATEYAASTADALGTTLEPDLDTWATEVDGFDNNAAANIVSESLYLRYLETAEKLANEVFESSTLRAGVVTCGEADDAACIQDVVSRLGPRLFRRPLLEDELVAYEAAYARARARGLDHDGSLREVLIALAASAQFVYRMELAPLDAGTQPIGPYDMAARLSYLLWSSGPDAQLLQDAEQDSLSTDAQLAASVGRLLQSPKAARFTESFAGQWLGARRLPEQSFDPATLPQWTPSLASAAADELYAFFDELVQSDADFRSFFDSRAHFVNAELAPLYGLSAAGTALTRVELSGVDRRGFLGLVGFLAQTSPAKRSSPSRRGAWIVERLLCSDLPPPPQDMPLFQDSDYRIRVALDVVNEQSGCGGCHEQIDAFGLALENYDAIGRYRTVYSDAGALDPKVTLPVSSALPEPLEVLGNAGLSQALASSPAFAACTARKLYTYGMGRAFSEAESPNTKALAGQWRAGDLTLKQLILRLVQSPTFRMRSDGGQL
jgi:hypothetical protein